MLRKLTFLYIMKTKLAQLPLKIDIETKAVLKSLPSAHAALAELKLEMYYHEQKKSNTNCKRAECN